LGMSASQRISGRSAGTFRWRERYGEPPEGAKLATGGEQFSAVAARSAALARANPKLRGNLPRRERGCTWEPTET
jgi:hypothetical protein